jgi:Fic family protein
MPRAIALAPEALLRILTQFPAGAKPDQLLPRLPDVSRSTLNRVLRDLVAEGRIQAQRQGSARKYLIAALNIQPATPAPDEVVLLSQEGLTLRAYLRQPLAKRTPVGYQREFLERYTPNVTFYLPSALRRKLAEFGKTTAARPAGTYAREILNRLLIDLSWASSRLEGNTYSLLDTRRLIEEGVRAEGKSADETLMILNHKRAIEFMVDNAADLGYSPLMVRNIHACLADGLPADPGAPGRLRQRPVYIEKSVYIPPQVPQLVEELFAAVLERASAIADPFEQSFFTMVHLPYLQPFEDVNKRTSRLCANIPFIRANLCPLSYIDVTERDYVDGLFGVYEQTNVAILRDVIAWAYERSSARYKAIRDSLGEPDPFRLRYRPQLADAMRAAVTAGTPVTVSLESAVIPREDKERLRAMIVKELQELHDGSLARFGIRPAEFAKWVQNGRRVT